MSQRQPFPAGVDYVGHFATAMRTLTITPSALENKFKASIGEAEADGGLSSGIRGEPREHSETFFFPNEQRVESKSQRWHGGVHVEYFTRFWPESGVPMHWLHVLQFPLL